MSNELKEWLQKTGAPAPPTLLHLMIKTGLPQEFIARHLDYVETQAQGVDFDAGRFRRTSPAFAVWLAQHPEHAATAAAQDLSKLNSLEKL